MLVKLEGDDTDLDVENIVDLGVGTTIFYHRPNLYDNKIHAFVASKNCGGVNGGFDGSKGAVCDYCGETIQGIDKMEDGISWTLGIIKAIV